MSQPSARGWQHNEDTVTVPLVRPARFMLRGSSEPHGRLRTLPSIDVEEDTEDWDQRTNELARPPLDSITEQQPPSRALPPVPAFARPPLALVKPARRISSLPPPRVPSAPPRPRPRLASLPPVPSAPPRPRLSSLPPAPSAPPRPSPSSLPLAPRAPLHSSLPPIPAFVRAPESELPEVEVDELLRVEQTESVEPILPPSIVVHDELVSDPRGLSQSLPTEPAKHDYQAFAPGWGPPPEIQPARLETPLPPPSEVTHATRDWLVEALQSSRRGVRARPWLAVLVAVTVLGVVALVFSALVSRVADARLAARTRVVTASDLAGVPLAQATVFVDGVAQCNALPCELELADGSHWVSLRSSGFQSPPAHPLTTGDGAPRHIHFQLRHEAAPSAAAAPKPLAVEAAAPTPVATVKLAPPPAVEPAPEPAAEPAPAPKAVARAPRRAVASAGGARLNINSIPASNVVLDGRPLGQTPRLGVSVSPGAHTVVFIHGKKRVVRGAMARAGKTSVVSARL